ncbi:hypothetical protein FNU76_01385 [Chitinimonas arctica]|uniref:Leucine-rich repeat domain-containing protein n=1 Tax=Chitinimonas arctica TaxID=2594795 RepID=A0A516SAD9_9NEIS|nr:hypothetical protein [Chitinimonas arctica]QDQ25114.1 hypothetical protein FNU76_01385 [Chitinimonas arctica]
MIASNVGGVKMPGTIPNASLAGISNQKLREAIRRLRANDYTLTNLDLSDMRGDNQIDDSSARVLAEAITCNTCLTQLDLRWNQIGDIGAQALADVIAGNTCLAALYLGNNKIGDDGAQALAKALASNKYLTTLSLGSNQIGDSGAQALAEALASNTRLSYLDLGTNRIGDSDAQALRVLGSKARVTCVSQYQKLDW